MNLLVTLNSKYIYPLCVMLRSLKASNPDTIFDIYVAHSSLTKEDFDEIYKNINNNMHIHPIIVDDKLFESAPVLSRISKETYYRLLIDSFLPDDIDRILYLDPDVVVINSLDDFYNVDMEGNVVAACPHMYGFLEFCNRVRLGLTLKRGRRYVNAGVILIDVKAWRKAIDSKGILDFVAKNIRKLKLSDQDALNILFHGRMLIADERKYNLDEKTFFHFNRPGRVIKRYKRIDLDWVEKNTVIVHFNGSKKPWGTEKYKGKLGGYFESYR